MTYLLFIRRLNLGGTTMKKYFSIIFITLLFLTGCQEQTGINFLENEEDVSAYLSDYEVLESVISDDIISYTYDINDEVASLGYDDFSIYDAETDLLSLLLSDGNQYSLANCFLSDEQTMLDLQGEPFTTDNLIIDVVNSRANVFVELETTDSGFDILFIAVEDREVLLKFSSNTLPFYYSNDSYVVFSITETQGNAFCEKIIAIDVKNTDSLPQYIIHEKEYTGSDFTDLVGEKLVSLGMTENDLVFQTFSSENGLFNIYNCDTNAINSTETNSLIPETNTVMYVDIFLSDTLFLGNANATDKVVEQSVIFANSEDKYLLPDISSASKLSVVGSLQNEDVVLQIDTGLYILSSNGMLKMTGDTDIYYADISNDNSVYAYSDDAIYKYIKNEAVYDEATEEHRDNLQTLMILSDVTSLAEDDDFIYYLETSIYGENAKYTSPQGTENIVWKYDINTNECTVLARGHIIMGEITVSNNEIFLPFVDEDLND